MAAFDKSCLLAAAWAAGTDAADPRLSPYSLLRGRPVLTQQTRAYRQRVRGLVRSSGIPTLLGPLAVRLELFPPDDRRRDCDNAQKSLLDALVQAGAFVDDSQIVWLLSVKAPPQPDGKAVVIASSLLDEPLPSSALEPTIQP